jgi:uncharacterized membrane protein YjjP (DUF1212 family)
MTPQSGSAEGVRTIEIPTEAQWRLLCYITRLLLEYSARSEMIERQIERLARHFDVDVSVSIAYREAALFSAGDRCCHIRVPEHRINATVNLATIHAVDDICAVRIGVEEAIERLKAAEHAGPEYGRWWLALFFGVGSSALAWILRADWGAIAVSGFSAGLGLLARKELAKRHVSVFALPFTAALIGALLGGAVIRAGWTQTAGIGLIVPALMIVPGVHLIVSVLEMMENHMQAGIARFGFAFTILVAAALGVLLGVRAVLGTPGLSATPSSGMQLTLPLDVVLAGLVACAFAMACNTPKRVLWAAIACGMVGHGIRFAGMEQGMSQALATLIGCLVIGVGAQIAESRFRLPFAIIAFAGAVTMMPGLFIYESFAGAISISAAGRGADPVLVATSVALFMKAIVVLGAMTIGLLLGARVGGWMKIAPIASTTVA